MFSVIFDYLRFPCHIICVRGKQSKPPYYVFCFFAELRGTGARQSGRVHDVDGRGEADIPALFAGAAHFGHVAHQLRGARRLHEPTSATGAQGADESQPHRHPASLCRGTTPWRE